MTHDLAVRDYCTGLACLLLGVAALAALNTYWTGGIDALVNAHAQQPFYMLALFGALCWLCRSAIGARVSQVTGESKQLVAATKARSASTFRLPMQRMKSVQLNSVNAPVVILAACVTAVATGSAMMLFNKEQAAYGLTDFYKNTVVEFSSVENCQAFMIRRFGEDYGKAHCFVK